MPPPSSADPGLQVHPFRALTYAARSPEQLARVSSPAYDLVTSGGRERLAAADPHNVVRLILPDVPAAPGQPAGDRAARSAAQAASTLAAWRDEGVLVHDDAPALWCYRMAGPAGSVTTGWLGAVQLPAPGSTAVLPHEDVFAPAVEGRRLLLAATGTDLEPIVLAHDPDDAVTEATARVLQRPADLVVVDTDGVRHELRRVAAGPDVEQVVGGLAQTRAVIADGHHRFAAARAHAAGAPGRVLALLTPMGPGGLRVHAIHRVVPGLDLERATGLAERDFAVERLGGPAEQVAEAWVGEPGSACFLVTDGHRTARLSEPSAAARARIPGEAPAAWRSLDVVLAHHGLLSGSWGLPDDPAAVLVAHDLEEAFRLARGTGGVALLLRSSSPADVAAVARAGARMPRKSTLFVPKPRTGLVFRPH
ncbi:DUF1015 family protein [Klenkia brasiliensis]|uniref:Uncharacterized conserved protein, DUF1015 family n=1 Tax=Klenkia brasiliensis TaxID=333142 RepID=A0A1G8AE87_9ACTN|nr:DUF1015 domain-containing protein [Klenkia brasiliensis]SDH19284.1 Uncharacterized conserved protein, DUF1015 family [Klenkia brasiliensis]